MTDLRFPIRRKLTIGALVPLSVAIFVCWLAGLYIINSRIANQAQEKVRTDLNSAREVYQNELAHIRAVVKLTAGTHFTAAAIASGDRESIARLLSPLRSNEQLDILTAVDERGRVLFRARNPDVFGDPHGELPLVARALKGEVVSGTEVLPPVELAEEGEELGRQATIEVVATPRAKPGGPPIERSGMVLVSAAPVLNGAGKTVGALYGGILLNKNNSLVDKIKRIVYEGVQFKGQDVGTATIFLDDLRIATNVQASDGRRAIGTRLSEEVYNRVILNRDKWVGRAFVVNDWYITAYEPIFDLGGNAVGSLYVGMLEKPYSALRRNVHLVLGAVLLTGSLIGLAMSGFIGSMLARPIRELENVARRVAAGERGVRIEVESRDEIGALAGEFNEMTRALTQREEEIRELNRGLERKVLERTTQLEEKNLLLLKTREELLRVEKLAAVGELAAGVAHEINNPMAIIRGNAELLQMALPPEDTNREEVDTIAQQVLRVERIVANLLKFARHERRHLGKADINAIMDEILEQIGHQVSLAGITVIRDYAAGLEAIEGDADQLRQVFTNLVLNAVQAMSDGGELTVATRRILNSELRIMNSKFKIQNSKFDGDFIEISVEDTGQGIAPENLGQIFNPFFTTKAGGTGLGLSVSYGIVKEHDGRIVVDSAPGKGTAFRVILPLNGGADAR